MANKLPKEKQIAVIHALAEGVSIRSIERITGVNRNTIMSLGIRVGKACERIMDEKMRNLNCSQIQMDEIWGFIGKKQANLRPGDKEKGLGDIWTWISIDADSRMVPSYRVGKRDSYNAKCFVDDLAARLNGEVQISTDALAAYGDAIERGFGTDASHGQIVKTFVSSELAARRYSPPEILHVTRKAISGNPDPTRISTSYVERQNFTMRMHMRRLTRLTNAFSKKLENFKAAVALYFAYYNFVKIHTSFRVTPAMQAGVTNTVWTIADLLDAAA